MIDKTKHSTKKRISNQYQEAFSKIKQYILEGHMVPGQRLLEHDLAEQLNMSRTPIREALRELEAKGYAKKISSRKLVIANNDKPKDIQNIMEVHVALDPLADSLSCKRSTKAHIEQAGKSYKLCEEAIEDRNFELISVLNKAFHLDLIAGCGNERILSIIRILYDQTLDARIFSFYGEQHWKRMSEQHKKLLEALEARDAKTAGRIQLAHTSEFLNFAMEHIL